MLSSFQGHTVVVTGAGGALGKAYSLLFASLGANVVAHDIDATAAQKVAGEILRAGGKAVSNSSSVLDGEAVIQSALDAFGNITVLINNAGDANIVAFEDMADNDWEQVIAVHLKGAFMCAKAAWPHFRRQNFGRIINTSGLDIYGSNGRAHCSAAKMGLVSLTKTLAWEGAKYNIKATAIAPILASSRLGSVIPQNMLERLKPEFIAPFVAAVCHPAGPDASGKLFEVSAGFAAEIRWQRSQGVLFKTDDSFTPSAIKARWDEVTDWARPNYPYDAMDLAGRRKLEAAPRPRANPQARPEVRFDGQTVVVTGAGQGLGRAYARMFARLGANVVVNDINADPCRSVVEEIVAAGGKATAVACSAEDGEYIVRVAVEKYGAVHVLIANAGIARVNPIFKMTEQQWDDVLSVHLRGTYRCAKAVWPIFRKQRYGRIVTTGSQIGLYGNFAQSNYSAAKGSIIGLTRTLAIEGKKHNIIANTMIPSAGTTMTEPIWPKDMLDSYKPDYVAPFVGYLASSDVEATGGIFEALNGWGAQIRLQHASGCGFSARDSAASSVEDVMERWHGFTDFEDGRARYPRTALEASRMIVQDLGLIETDGGKFRGKL
ncbi:hypothetical protein HGRIS_003790 [Hohenbuehelia grisea]|uniref:Peroxisomal hydratase-dehydrogenase-epimerase n=1 Tax=Hohenbuehelia grisea TaxID=104357 RepID=A0ABR3JI50_9AGAR